MQLKRITPICILMLSLAVAVVAQGSQDAPVLKTRPHTQSLPNQQSLPATPPEQDYSQPSDTYHGQQPREASGNAVPQGTRFLVTLMEPLDTRSLAAGQHFRAALREDLVTPSGLVVSHGREVRAHVATFERGYMGARMMLAFDEVDTAGGWVPLIATLTGVPGDPSIKPTSNEGEITQRGPDKRRLIMNAAIGAAVGAASGAAAGGGKGAAAGAAAGAGLGTTASFLMQGSDLKLDQGANLELRLDRDLAVPVQ
ncbi:MAG TPA: hypothetical protein VKW06_06125 [Candidatus Angelobacter sp.]|nr:hypothetical protein [Candidatus Angelobacter sp.]